MGRCPEYLIAAVACWVPTRARGSSPKDFCDPALAGGQCDREGWPDRDAVLAREQGSESRSDKPRLPRDMTHTLGPPFWILGVWNIVEE